MLRVLLDWEKIYKIVLEKALVFILWCFYLFLVLLWKNFKNGPSERWHFFFFEIGHIRYKKARILCWFQKWKLTLVTKCPKKVKIKKRTKMGLSKIRKPFFNFNIFWGQFVTLTSLLFWIQHKILDFLIPYMTYLKKKIYISEGLFFKFWDTKTQKR
jgi:hypothetical protein